MLPRMRQNREHPPGLSTTKPGTLLKKSIAVRTYTAWDEEKPGFLEIDLVAHCGQSTEGQFINTLTCVDLSTGWVECLAVLTRNKQTVFEAIKTMRTRLPFALLGLDSDNGSEFINDLLFQYCQYQEITFTRSRPYRKNDQAHVEQKNWSLVRRLIGYDRFETEAEWQLLQSIYEDGPGRTIFRNHVYLRTTRTALCPPKPKALLIAIFTSAFRAVFGT